MAYLFGSIAEHAFAVFAYALLAVRFVFGVLARFTFVRFARFRFFTVFLLAWGFPLGLFLQLFELMFFAPVFAFFAFQTCERSRVVLGGTMAAVAGGPMAALMVSRTSAMIRVRQGHRRR